MKEGDYVVSLVDVIDEQSGDVVAMVGWRGEIVTAYPSDGWFVSDGGFEVRYEISGKCADQDADQISCNIIGANVYGAIQEYLVDEDTPVPD